MLIGSIILTRIEEQCVCMCVFSLIDEIVIAAHVTDKTEPFLSPAVVFPCVGIEELRLAHAD